METKKVLGITFSLLFIVTFAFCAVWVGINWSTVKDSLSGTQLYTEADINSAYADGYDTALTQADTYAELISQYRDTITTLTSQVSTLTNNNSDYAILVTNLNAQLDAFEITIAELNSSSQEDDATISNLNQQVTALQVSIAYYVAYLANLTSETYVVATFEVDDSVYSIVLVDPSATTSVTAPTSTDYKVFAGWTVDGTLVDLSTYAISEDTTFIAVFTSFYEVTFTVDDETYNSQIIEQNASATVPTTPTKEGYEFMGWKSDGNIINISTYTISQITNFTAEWAEILPYICDSEGNLLHYIGNSTNVEIPSTYSLGIYVQNYVLVTLDTGMTYQSLMSISEQPYDMASQAWAAALGVSASDAYDILSSSGSYDLIGYENYNCSLITGPGNCYFEITVDYYEVLSGDDYTVTTITTSAFNVSDSFDNENANNILSIYIPNTIITIEETAFYQLRHLQVVTFSENSSLTTVGNFAFAWCPDLTTCHLPDSVVNVGQYIFSGSTLLIN